jgi:methylenetetrahydrofolate reductase (NADPH)
VTTAGDERAAPEEKRYFGNLHRTLDEGTFTVTAEVVPPRGSTLRGVQRIARHLHDWVDGANITDGQGAVTRMSSWAGCIGLMREDVEPVMQLQCRDRNRIALQADLMGASAVGIPNVLCLTGDHPRFGDHPDAKPVFDLDSTQLAWTARTLRDSGHLLSGLKLSVAPKFMIGAVENPTAAPQRFRAERLGKKIAAGAQFVQTQFVFDVPTFDRWMQQVRSLGLHNKCYILAGVGPIRSPRALEVLSDLPGVYIPEETVKRLRSVPEDRWEKESMALCSETVLALKAMEGVRGIHVVASGWDDFIPEMLTMSGIGNKAERLAVSQRLVEGLTTKT